MLHPPSTAAISSPGPATAAAGVLVVQPSQAAAAAANSQITLGLIGCGGRGKWIAKLFQQHGGYRFVATADYFPNRAREAAALLEVPEGRAFSGLSAYKRMLDARPDAVVIESPPYFHAEQALAGVGAGCHVYCPSRSRWTCLAAAPWPRPVAWGRRKTASC